MRRLVVALVTAAIVFAASAPPAGARSRPVDVASIELLGEATLPTGFDFDGTEVGGLSGAVLDEETFAAIRDGDDVLGALSDAAVEIRDAHVAELNRWLQRHS